MFRVELTVIKVLRHLKAAKKECSEEEIVSAIKEQREQVNEVLRTLESKKLVEVCNYAPYSYKIKNHVEPVVDKILRIYEDATDAENVSKEKLFVGLFSTFSPLRPSTVIKAFEEFGFGREETEDLIEDEVRKGRVKKIRAICAGEIYSGSRFFPVGIYMKEEFGSDSLDRVTDIEECSKEEKEKRIKEERMKEVKKYYKPLGLEGMAHEEVLLMGNYPLRLAKKGREYLNKWKGVKEKVRKELPHIFRWIPLQNGLGSGLELRNTLLYEDME